MRTQSEIVARMKDFSDNRYRDFFCVMRKDLIGYLDWEHAKPFLKDGITADQWREAEEWTPPTRDAVLDAMAGYLPFAFDKAHHQRGISAGRSLDHFSNWIWLLGPEAMEHFGSFADYDNYGLGHLERIKVWLTQNGKDVTK